MNKGIDPGPTPARYPTPRRLTPDPGPDPVGGGVRRAGVVVEWITGLHADTRNRPRLAGEECAYDAFSR